MSDPCHSEVPSNTSQRNEGFLTRPSHLSGPTFPVFTGRSLPATSHTWDSCKHWEPTACPLCCQALPLHLLHQSPCPKYKPPALRMPGLGSYQAHDNPRWLIHGGISAINQVSFPSQTILWLYHLIPFKTNTMKDEKAPNWMNPLLCFTLQLHE